MAKFFHFCILINARVIEKPFNSPVSKVRMIPFKWINLLRSVNWCCRQLPIWIVIRPSLPTSEQKNSFWKLLSKDYNLLRTFFFFLVGKIRFLCKPEFATMSIRQSPNFSFTLANFWVDSSCTQRHLAPAKCQGTF
jgi:hypothetical protein